MVRGHGAELSPPANSLHCCQMGMAGRDRLGRETDGKTGPTGLQLRCAGIQRCLMRLQILKYKQKKMKA